MYMQSGISIIMLIWEGTCTRLSSDIRSDTTFYGSANVWPFKLSFGHYTIESDDIHPEITSLNAVVPDSFQIPIMSLLDNLKQIQTFVIPMMI